MDGGSATEVRDPPSVVADDAVSTKIQKAAQPLYAARIKVHPKSVAGLYRTIKWIVLGLCLTVYYVAPWLRWDRGPAAPDQAILIDMPGRKAYFFMIEIWPQEVYFLTGLLVIAAITLFLMTSLFGRLWCGYACPQTVWTDLFMLVERWIEGDRNARIRLDAAPNSASKILKRTAKHASWLAIAMATGGAWVLYFGDAPTLFIDIFAGRASFTEYFFIGLFTATTYTLAGLAREQVCTYMCPWPRFQSAMLDDQSYVVTYEGWRGEPRGKLAKKAAGIDPWAGRGDCVDCNSCVATCPTGIDIRDGQQLECIGCGLCVDACNAVMDKVGRPRELIRFDTLANQDARARGEPVTHRFVRPRTILYAAVLLLVGSVMLAALLMRTTVELNVLRDRNPLFSTLVDGRIRNAFTIHVLNKTHESQIYRLHISGVTGAELSAVDEKAADNVLTIVAKPDSVASGRVFVTASPADLKNAASTKIEFTLEKDGSSIRAAYDSVFLAPGR